VLARQRSTDLLVLVGISVYPPSLLWPEPRVKNAPWAWVPGTVRAATLSASAGE
jgi:hypothetical protein